jgi:hypothetical protein
VTSDCDNQWIAAGESLLGGSLLVVDRCWWIAAGWIAAGKSLLLVTAGDCWWLRQRRNRCWWPICTAAVVVVISSSVAVVEMVAASAVGAVSPLPTPGNQRRRRRRYLDNVCTFRAASSGDPLAPVSPGGVIFPGNIEAPEGQKYCRRNYKRIAVARVTDPDPDPARISKRIAAIRLCHCCQLYRSFL